MKALGNTYMDYDINDPSVIVRSKFIVISKYILYQWPCTTGNPANYIDAGKE